MAWAIQLACHWKLTDFAYQIEKAFAKNLVDTAICGDWSVVRERLGVQGQGLSMPAKPLNLVEQRKLDSGVCIFSDAPLYVDSELDEEAYRSYIDKACSSFAESQEWKSLDRPYESPRYLETFLDTALQYFGLNVENMSASGLSELMLECFPRQVTIDLHETSDLVDELIAFWKFCGRAFGLEHAQANVNFLVKNRRQIQREMANGNNFGIAKSLLQMASDDGFDTDRPEELNEFIENLNMNAISRLAGFRGLAHDEPQYSLAGPTTQDLRIDEHHVEHPVVAKSLTPPLPLKERKKLLAKLKKRK